MNTTHHPRRSKLNLKQRCFAVEYLKSGNATDAAKRAGYSPKTAYSQGPPNRTTVPRRDCGTSWRAG